MKPGSLMGRLANGFQSDAGRLVHAVPDHTTQYATHTRALCGAKPGRRSGGWDVDHVGTVSCIRCVSRMQREQL